MEKIEYIRIVAFLRRVPTKKLAEKLDRVGWTRYSASVYVRMTRTDLIGFRVEELQFAIRDHPPEKIITMPEENFVAWQPYWEENRYMQNPED
ncbi:hypothetical protein [Stenoxybacter acetivorans]|uniref:hypothetical protein n=1 Tax=Stenoxybacter acetivorans TaxID=422441 RepID=UPI000562A45D|nr:hypothetical protein [Stenoxybacter acetivorans]